MPCDDYRDSSADRMKIICLEGRIDELAQNLCYLCASLMDAGELEKYANGRILGWHKVHMEHDNERVRIKMRDECNEDKDMLENPEKMAEKFISLAESEHPVSNWHKKWFHQMAEEVARGVKEEKANEIEREKKRKKIILKLTKEEKEILGL